MRSSYLGVRVFVDARRGFALANLASGEIYPASTTDGGKRWRINGPLFYIPAADAPAFVSQVGAAPPGTYFAFGGGSVVDLTTDSGVHWYRAFLGEDVLSVVPGTKAHHLIAIVQDGSGGTRVISVVYLSTDGGRHWHRTNRFAS